MEYGCEKRVPQQITDSGEVVAKALPNTVFDEIALRASDHTKRVHSLRMAFESKINRLIGPDMKGETCSEDTPQPPSAVDAAFRSLDELGHAINGLEIELTRINKLVGE